MKSYTLIVLLSSGDEYFEEVNSLLMSFLHDEGRKAVVLGNLDAYTTSVLKSRNPICFNSLVDSTESLKREVADGEQIIGFDVHDSDPLDMALYISRQMNCSVIFTLGPDERTLAMHRFIRPTFMLQLTENGDKIFKCSSDSDLSYETLVDQLINVDSLSHSPFFDHDKPMVVLSDIIGDTITGQLVIVAAHMGISLVATTKEEAFADLSRYRAILTVKGIEYSNVTISYGLPFEYVNIRSNFLEACNFIRTMVQYENRGEWS